MIVSLNPSYVRAPCFCWPATLLGFFIQWCHSCVCVCVFIWSAPVQGCTWRLNIQQVDSLNQHACHPGSNGNSSRILSFSDLTLSTTEKYVMLKKTLMIESQKWLLSNLWCTFNIKTSQKPKMGHLCCFCKTKKTDQRWGWNYWCKQKCTQHCLVKVAISFLKLNKRK